MRTCDIINELEDTELASKIRRQYLVQGIDIERDVYNLGSVIMSFNWGSGKDEIYWNDQYTKATNSSYKKSSTKLVDIFTEEDEDEEYNEDEEDDFQL